MTRDDLDRPYAGGFVGAEHRFALRVYFEDTDLTGVVYHANYLRYMERARSDMLRAAGIDQRAAQEDGTGAYVVADLAIRYLAPARLDDAVQVVSRVMRVGAASCVIQQTVMRGTVVLATAEVTAAFVSPQGRPRRQPRAWIDIFERLTEDDRGA
ncbi:tol-pal system-associated acyl-CoA thioesterase [Sphingomonas montana]|uniref:tol-pal system-associated acyl-CoA thioesterase n=1 Tax=Sphingomonas montana TaxID=1843236 RepID=UPI00096DE6D9|nr:tol-pal system-associated acyl-CoA thioesterase [Sphingomonas montana]